MPRSRRRKRPRKRFRPKAAPLGRFHFRVRPIMGQEEEEALRVIRSHDEMDARYAKRYYDEYFYSKARSRDQVFVAVTRANRVIGVSGYFSDVKEPRGIFWLAWTYVLPVYRRYGVGAVLLSTIERVLRRKAARKLYLNTSGHTIYHGAVIFYLNHGFRWEGYLQDYYRRGEDLIILGKDLD